MASKAVKWLIGCGVGCLGVTVIVIVLVVAGSASLVRNTTRGFDEAVERRGTLQERFGDPGDFTPPADGTIARERIEAFIGVREAMRPAREGIEQFFRVLPTSRDAAEELEAQPPMKKLGSILGITRSAFGFGEDLGELYRSRNQGLMDSGMSLGEYTYLYVLVYDSWLGHSLDEGPEFEGGHDASLASDRLLDRVRDDLFGMLEGQLAALHEGPLDDPWRRSLSDEIARLRVDDEALPWQDGLPDPILASLSPYRERLESSFSTYSNAFELGQARKRGRFSFDVE